MQQELLRSEFDEFCDKVNLLLLLDPSGRGGNYFVQSIFDNNEEVLSCPWVQYLYSYYITRFQDKDIVDSQEAHKLWSEKSYFRLTYQPCEGEIASTILSFGSELEVDLEREIVREVFDKITLENKDISRKQLLLAGYFAIAKGKKVDTKKIKYILASDAVSLRSENPKTGYSLSTYRSAVKDFPNLKLIWLTRDLRAAFASCRHQYVNRVGSMYGVLDQSWSYRLLNLIKRDPDTEGCVWLYWIWYFKATEKIMRFLLEIYDDKQLYILKNESLNTNFIEEINNFSNWLGIKGSKEWYNDPYVPTNVGKKWKGKGAYCSHYHKGWEILKNDTPEVSSASAGPNKYVTERWKKALGEREIEILSTIFDCELNFYQYPHSKLSFVKMIFYIILPWKGELPSKLVISDYIAPNKIHHLLKYIIIYPILYTLSRIGFLEMYLTNQTSPYNKSISSYMGGKSRDR